ncbi:MAG: hypothetical protein KC609_03070, partial [Myxococcales bacterium]|nr:hypothetical protein [Myxococcales bacterium]
MSEKSSCTQIESRRPRASGLVAAFVALGRRRGAAIGGSLLFFAVAQILGCGFQLPSSGRT